nr:hypothetical protein [Tanacetum cinerariifolium]
MLGVKERIKLDLEARLMRKTLVLNRSLDPLYRDYIELNDLNVSLELMIDQVDDLMPTIGEGVVGNMDGYRDRHGRYHSWRTVLQSFMCGSKDYVKITKKQSKSDKIEHEITKIAQKPDQRTFSVQVIKSKALENSNGRYRD